MSSIASIVIIATLALHPDTRLIQEVSDKKIVTHRPYHLTGELKIGNQSFKYGSGGNGASIPYGDHKITPGALGSWGEHHKAIGLADGTIPDPQLDRDREGIEIHAADHLESAGCIVVLEKYFKALKEAIQSMIAANGQAFLHVHPDGVSITPEQNFDSSVIYVAQKEPIKTKHHSEQQKQHTERHRHHTHIAQHHHRHAHHSHYASS
jgi:hypothetical protein